MPDKLKEFVRQTMAELMEKLSAEERLKGLPAEELRKRLTAEECLKGLPAEERVKGLTVQELVRALSPEMREALAHELQGNGTSPKPLP